MDNVDANITRRTYLLVREYLYRVPWEHFFFKNVLVIFPLIKRYKGTVFLDTGFWGLHINRYGGAQKTKFWRLRARKVYTPRLNLHTPAFHHFQN